MKDICKKRIFRHFYECRYIYAAFFISAAVFVTVCFARHIWPFGGRSILKVDLFHQYAPYLEEFRSRVVSGKSLLYSWETGLGKDFPAQTAYYATSPLNILIFLFPEKMISEVLALLIMLKICLSSSSFTFYLREHFRRNDLSILVFGLLYGFCAFVTCYYWNNMWMDTVALFPLTALGCERLIREKKITLYYAALTMTMIVNFYLAVLVCIMITLYALVVAFTEGPYLGTAMINDPVRFPSGLPSAAKNVHRDASECGNRKAAEYDVREASECNNREAAKRDGKDAAKSGHRDTGRGDFDESSFVRKTLRRAYLSAMLRFMIVSVLSAMTAMIILGPVAAALRETEVSGSTFPAPFVYPNIWQLVSAHFLGARDAVLARNEDMPNVYTGLLTLVLLPFYYITRKVSFREKLLHSSLLIFMLLCSCISTLDFMIHGFHYPANLPHRFTFVYSFILLGMAYRGGTAYLFPVKKKRKPEAVREKTEPRPVPEDQNGARRAATDIIPGNYYRDHAATAAVPEESAGEQIKPSATAAVPEESVGEQIKPAATAAVPEESVGEQIEPSATAAVPEESVGEQIEPAATDAVPKKNGRNTAAAAAEKISRSRKTVKLPYPLRVLYISVALGIAAILLYESLIEPLFVDIDHVLSGTDLVLNIVLTAVYLAVITYVVLGARKHGRSWKRNVMSRFVLPFLLVCVIGECVFSLYQNMYDTADHEEYIARLDDTAAAMEFLEAEHEGDFFRTDFRRFVTINEGSLYHFNGFSHFSSLAPGGLCAMLEDLGVAAASNSFRYYDTSPLLDAIFRIRCCLTDEAAFPDADMAYKYSAEHVVGNILIGENERVLPLGFMVSDQILDWNTEDSKPFDVQNEFVHLASGTEQDVFTTLPPSLIEATNMEVYDVNEVGDAFSYSLYDPYDLSMVPSIHAEFVADRDMCLCLYVDAPNAIRFIFETDSVREDREISAGRSTINVGFVSAGEKITADFELTRRGEFDRCYTPGGGVRLFAASWNDDVFQTVFDKLNSEPLEITGFKDTEIRGTVNASEDGILFTSIPFTSGWKAMVDGSPVEKVGIGNNGLVGVPVPEGAHEIVLQYESPFLVPSVICTILGPILFIIYKKTIRG